MIYRLLLVEEDPGLAKLLTDRLRKNGGPSETPILILTAASPMHPLDNRELQSRIERILQDAVRSTAYRLGGLRLNFVTCEVVGRGKRIPLSERECRLLRYFVEHKGQIVSREKLLQDVWGYDSTPFTRTVDVHILRLRKKIEADPKNPRFIVTVHGLGYRFDG